MTSQYGAYSLPAAKARLRACTRPRARANSRTRAITHTHVYVILIAFPRQQRFANAPQCYVYVACLVFIAGRFCLIQILKTQITRTPDRRVCKGFPPKKGFVMLRVLLIQVSLQSLFATMRTRLKPRVCCHVTSRRVCSAFASFIHSQQLISTTTTAVRLKTGCRTHAVQWPTAFSYYHSSSL